MKIKLDENWTTNNNNVPLNDEEVARYNAILPNQNQIRLSQKPFYVFMHFGMNTANNREWGNATEAVQDFDKPVVFLILLRLKNFPSYSEAHNVCAGIIKYVQIACEKSVEFFITVWLFEADVKSSEYALSAVLISYCG